MLQFTQDRPVLILAFLSLNTFKMDDQSELIVYGGFKVN